MGSMLRNGVGGTLIAVLLLLFSRGTANAYYCIQTSNGTCIRWTSGGATLRTFLGSQLMQLMNGTMSWDQNAQNAANEWNAAGAAFRFNVVVGGVLNDPCGPAGPNHACPNTGPPGDNPVLFRSSVCGTGNGFGDIVAATVNCYNANSGAMINAPVFVNSTVQWNAYDGPGQPPINDIHRVLLHEFGHVLGLDHPDTHGQVVAAIMNSQESNVDRLQADDIQGIMFLYPNPTAPANLGCHLGGAATPWASIALLLLPLMLCAARIVLRAIATHPLS